MTEKQKRYVFTVSPGLDDLMKRAAATRDMSIAAWVREALASAAKRALSKPNDLVAGGGK